MHVYDPDSCNLGTNGIVGGSIPLAAGAALSARIRGSGQVAVSFFGDGALNQGLLFETMNMAAVWKLPVVFTCENNRYGEFTETDDVTGETVFRLRFLYDPQTMAALEAPPADDPTEPDAGPPIAPPADDSGPQDPEAAPAETEPVVAASNRELSR